MTLAYNVNSREEVDDIVERAQLAWASIGSAGAGTFWGGASGILISKIDGATSFGC